MNNFNEERIDLPQEVWCHVFFYLPLYDRKNIRLTCRRFYECCNNIQIQNKEVFVFYGNINSNCAIQLLSNSRRKIWNIELCSVHLDMDIAHSFFEKQGIKVRSLVFRKCTFSPGILKSIIEYCSSLCNISLILDSCSLSTYENVMNDFKMIEKNSIARYTVTCFSVVFNHPDHGLSNCSFLRFLAVFPNVKSLDLEIEIGSGFDRFSTVSSDIMSDSEFTFSSVYYLLSTNGNQFEELRLHFKHFPFPYNSHLSVQTLNKISHIEMKNLKDISLNYFCHHRDCSVMNPFLTFKHLTCFDCIFSWRGTSIQAISTFLQLLLDSSTELRSLTVTLYYFEIDRELFQSLVRSKLITLKIKLYDDVPLSLFADFQPSYLENTLLPNYVLKIFQTEEESNLISLFSRYFRSLEYLVFPETSCDVLENIFEHQTNLQALSLYNCRKFPYKDCRFKKPRVLQQWITNNYLSLYGQLEHLTQLSIMEDENSLTDFMLKSEFMFPKLKSLNITINYNKKFGHERFFRMFQKLHQLEYLKLLLPFPTSFEQCLTLFHGIPKLRHFYIEDFRVEHFEDSEYRKLYEINSSLRTVVHRLRYESFQTSSKYLYDVTSNAVINIQEDSPFCEDFQSLVYKWIPSHYFRYYYD